MFLGRLLVRAYTPPLARLGKHPINTKATTPWQANQDLVSNLRSVVCVCSAFPVYCLAVTNITVYPTTRFHLTFHPSRAQTVHRFLSHADARSQGRPHCLHGRLPRTWPPTRRAL